MERHILVCDSCMQEIPATSQAQWTFYEMPNQYVVLAAPVYVGEEITYPELVRMQVCMTCFRGIEQLGKKVLSLRNKNNETKAS